MERLLESVIKGLEAKTDFKSRWCEKFNENCRDYLYNYGENIRVILYELGRT